MKKYTLFFSLMVSAAYFLSCQRELFFETIPPLPAAGYLQDSSGECLPKIVAGTFKVGSQTGDSNFIEVSIQVTRVGAYTVLTDTLNGYSFKATGNFSDTGLQQIKLPAAGTPLAAGVNTFSVRFDKSICQLNVNVLSNVVPVSPAVFTLSGSPDTCTPFSIEGTYIKDRSVNTDASVTLTLKVSAAGKYEIKTNEVNGYLFYAYGMVDTGLQKVTLRGLGLPLKMGTDYFTVTAGGSSCTFSIKVKNFVEVKGTDYFPLTTNSYWTYDDLTNGSDTIVRKVTDSFLVDNDLYKTMHEYNQYGDDQVYNFSKTNNGYFQYGPVDILTTAFRYAPQVLGRIHFLSQFLRLGDNWKSDEYNGKMNSTESIYLQYNYYCVDDNTVVTVNDNSFINVYHIVLLPQVRSAFGYPYNSTNEKIDLYYAKGIGIIYLHATNNAGYRSKELKLRYWKVY